jgi:hypothetical protein
MLNLAVHTVTTGSYRVKSVCQCNAVTNKTELQSIQRHVDNITYLVIIHHRHKITLFSNPSQPLPVYTAMILICHASQAFLMKICDIGSWLHPRSGCTRPGEKKIIYSCHESNPDSPVDRRVSQPLYWATQSTGNSDKLVTHNLTHPQPNCNHQHHPQYTDQQSLTLNHLLPPYI